MITIFSTVFSIFLLLIKSYRKELLSNGKILFVLILFQKIAEMAHAHGALLMVDNSIMSPVLSQPLTLGAGYKPSAIDVMLDFTNSEVFPYNFYFNRPFFLLDIVMHSATKFIAGHSDLMAGVLAVRGERSYLCSVLSD